MTFSELASALESRREGLEWRCRCPKHGGRSLSITEKDGRLLLVCRAGCSQAEVIEALKKMGLWGNASGYEIPPPTEPSKDDTERQAEKAERMWEQAAPIKEGDPLFRYLGNRGIRLEVWPQDIRAHPAIPYWQINDTEKPVRVGIYPAMIAVIRSPEGKPVALHRTYLTEDGKKAPVDSVKKIYGVHPIQGGAVRLFPPKDGFLAVAEGIEDALSAWILWRIPCWAVLGTSGLMTFDPPAGVKELIIFADRDENQAGQRAAWALADRMEEAGRAARVLVPEDGSKDLNAYLLARQEANMQEITR